MVFSNFKGVLNKLVFIRLDLLVVFKCLFMVILELFGYLIKI